MYEGRKKMREASDIRSEIAMTTTAVAALSEELRDGWGNEGGVGEEDDCRRGRQEKGAKLRTDRQSSLCSSE